jgi:hypothetical protein
LEADVVFTIANVSEDLVGENRMTNKTTIDDLLKDWQERATLGDDKLKAYYIERLRELVEYAADPRFELMPFQRKDKTYDYSIKILSGKK